MTHLEDSYLFGNFDILIEVVKASSTLEEHLVQTLVSHPEKEQQFECIPLEQPPLSTVKEISNEHHKANIKVVEKTGNILSFSTWGTDTYTAR